jgi:predicted DNA-binding transcriptional regulator AlpA
MSSVATNLNGNGIRPVPGLDDIARDSGCVAGLPTTTIAALMVRAAAVQSALAAAQLSASIQKSEPSRPKSSEPDPTLNAKEIAAELGQTRRWVFRHVKELNFIRRTSRKSLTAKASEVRRWRESQTA